MSDIIEYLFFTPQAADQFRQHLQQYAIDWQEERESVQNAMVFKVSEAIDPSIWDALDRLFDDLSAEDQRFTEQALEDDTAASAVGLYLQLTNGQQTVAKVDPDVVNRILSVLSVEELNQFLEVIVSSVEQPDDSAICQR
ncbi:MAG: hypothetical protein WAQ53_07305 [Thiofilum sp.]|uniref:hypothetical protein n=1 Tax=Thiofilum sp. TaxID=2212733 RepID=UPI0025D66ED6|nr:hypothetical protein [Thiofilum sp.]MBK8455249.1 hypothetical protein [Thiofilum sp.]